jgi:hypothetical protein
VKASRQCYRFGGTRLQTPKTNKEEQQGSCRQDRQIMYEVKWRGGKSLNIGINDLNKVELMTNTSSSEVMKRNA